MLCKTLLLCLLLHVAVSHRHKHDSSSHSSSSESGHSSEEIGQSAKEIGQNSKVIGHSSEEIGHSSEEIGQSSEEAGRDVRFPRAVTPAGAIRGSWMETRRGRRFRAFRGVRYAEAPVGQLRFQPPKPILSYKKEFDASKEGPACPTIADEYYYGNFSEDCLRLNVYTPLGADKKSPLPVVIFIHPGGFYGFSGRSDVAGPLYLLDRDLVLVTINYRLGSLGFLSTGDALAPGNNGMKDQVVALKWVQRNIRSFGGDPRRVTLAGVSAGSISVMLHMISPMSKGLFHHGISISGSPTVPEPYPHHQRDIAVKQAKLLGCPADSTSVIIDCLRTKTWRQIGDSLPGFYEFAFDPTLIWQPVVELDFGQERFLTIDPVEAIRSGAMHAVPHIISQTRLEFYWKAFTILRNSTLRSEMNSRWREIAPISFQLPRDRDNTEAVDTFREAYLHDKPLRDDAASADGLGKLYADAIIGFPVHRMALLMARHSPHPVWFYELSYVGQSSFYVDPVTKKPIGTVHHDDMLYLLSLPFAFPIITPGSPDSTLVDRMTAIWYNFARYGDPNPRGDTPELSSLSWPAMTFTDRKYLRIDKEFSVHENLFEDRYNVWEEVYPIQY